MTSSGLGALVALLLVLAPRLALACPSCAGNPEGGISRYVMIGLMIAAPYVAATVAIRAIRKGEAALRAQERPRSQPAGEGSS